MSSFKQSHPDTQISWNYPGLPNSSILEANEKLEVAPEVAREHELKFSLKRESGIEGTLLIQLPVVDRRATVVISGYQKRCSGLDLIDGAKAVNNEATRDGDPLTDGKIHRVVVRVTDEAIFTSVDGVVLIDWKGDKSRLSVPSWAEKKGLVITAGQETRFQILDLNLEGS